MSFKKKQRPTPRGDGYVPPPMPVEPVAMKAVVLPSSTSTLRYQGCRQFRERLVCATLAHRTIRIEDIRALDEAPGLRDFEASFLRLLEKITNGCEISINETGTSLKYKPGMISGGTVIGLTHACPTSRSIGYFIEPLLKLAPFAKRPIAITLTGITNDSTDTSVDVLRTVSVPILKRYGIDEPIEIKVRKRGAPPLGGGEVYFRCPIIKQLMPLQWLDEGKIKRVRGVAYTTRCSPQLANRMVDAARAVLNHLLPDVYIYTDHFKGKDSGLSPGFAISLVAESTSGVLLHAEVCGGEGILPEEVGKQCAEALLNEITRGGCVDQSHQSLAMLMMILGPEDVSKIRIGPLSNYTIECLRLYRDFFHTTFKLSTDPATDTVIATCLGTGFKNYSRKTV